MKSPSKQNGRPVSLDAEHRRIAAALRTRLHDGSWKAGAVVPSLYVLAREFKTSVGTVRLAIDVLKKEFRFTRNAYRRLTVRNSLDGPMDGRDAVLVVFTRPLSHFSSYTAELLKGIAEGAGKLGVPFTVVHAYCFQHTLPTAFLSWPLKGVILVGSFSAACLAEYARLPVAVVLADHPPAPRLRSVSVNNAEAAREATARLIQAGHRHIAFVRRILYTIDNVDPDSRERQEGFVRAFRDAGLRRSSKAIFNVLPERDSTYLVKGIFSAKARFTAAFCVDPNAADLVARAAGSAGRKIPDDFGLICFQGRHDTTAFSGPASDFADIGRRAVQHLSDAPPPLAPPRLIERVDAAWADRGSFCRIS